MTVYTGRVLSQVEVEERICRVLDALESRTEDFDQLAMTAAELEADYRHEYATTLLAVLNSATEKSTVGERQAKAEALTGRTHRKWLVAQAARNSCRESLTSLREQLNALRTLCANIRAQT